jgi:hypothetical protein
LTYRLVNVSVNPLARRGAWETEPGPCATGSRSADDFEATPKASARAASPRCGSDASRAPPTKATATTGPMMKDQSFMAISFVGPDGL